MKFLFQNITWKIHPKIDKIHTEWFLVIKDFLVLQKYLESLSKSLINDYMFLKQKTKEGHCTNKTQQAMEISLLCENNRKSMVDDINLISDKFLSTYEKIFFDRGLVYICKNNAIRPLTEKSIIAINKEIIKSDMIFPEFNEKDISISKWGNGKHYYARIGNVDIFDEFGNMKWNSYDTAKRNAIKTLKKLNAEY